MALLIPAIVLATVVALGKAKFMYTITLFSSTLSIGFVCGLLFGDMETALILATGIEAIYLGFSQSGGVIAADSIIATAITIPVVMVTGLDMDAGMALAVPIGALAANLNNFIYILNGFVYRDALNAVDEGNTRRITIDATVIPALIRILVTGSVVFVGILFGTTLIEAILDFVPQWIIDGFSVAGGVLPIIGFALVINSMKRPAFIPFFIIGFFLVQYVQGLNTMSIAIFAICFIFYIYFLRGDVDFKAIFAKPEGAEEKKHLLTQGDVTRLYWRWWFFVEVGHTFEGMQALARLNAFIPMLKKLYPDDKDELIAGLRRYSGYFNTNGTYGTAIFGVCMAIEEENALTHKMDDEELEETINGLSMGLMGPLAGVGDTIDWGTWNRTLRTIAMNYTAVGNPIGILIMVVGFFAITTVEGTVMINTGWRLGKDAINSLFEGGLTKRLTDASTMLGMLLMGALASQYCTFEFAIPTLQGIFNAIAPNLVVLILIFVIYWVIAKKTQKFGRITLCIIGIALILTFLGIA